MTFGKDPGILVFILSYHTFFLFNSESCLSICLCGIMKRDSSDSIRLWRSALTYPWKDTILKSICVQLRWQLKISLLSINVPTKCFCNTFLWPVCIAWMRLKILKITFLGKNQFFFTNRFTINIRTINSSSIKW